MTLRIEDYGLIGDCRTAALRGERGSIDWFCAPVRLRRVLRRLTGKAQNGRWLIAPKGEVRAVRADDTAKGRSCSRPNSSTATGTVKLVDAMALNTEVPTVVRLVEGISGSVDMQLELIIRFDYGAVVLGAGADGGVSAIAGPDMLRLGTAVDARREPHDGGRIHRLGRPARPFSLAWHPSYESPPPELDVEIAIEATDRTWREWSRKCTHEGP